MKLWFSHINRTSTQQHRETHALAQLLYHAMTTGCGQQTLGEEYCDIMQSTGCCRHIHLYDTTIGSNPILQTSSTIPQYTGTADGSLPSLSRRAALVALQSIAPYMLQRLATTGGDPEPSTSGAASGATSRSMAVPSTTCAPRVEHDGATTHDDDGMTAHATTHLVRRWRVWAVSHSRHVAQWLLQHGPLLLRIHVAVFYLYGTFFHWHKRLTGMLLV